MNMAYLHIGHCWIYVLKLFYNMFHYYVMYTYEHLRLFLGL